MHAKHNDWLAAAIFIATGLFFAGFSWFGLNLGRATRMGPGYFPLVLGLVLVGFGLLVAFQASRSRDEPGGPVAWRGLSLVTLAILWFGFTVRGLGLVPALAGAVLIACFATPRTSPLTAAALTAGLTAFCVGVFTYALGLPLDLIGPWLRS